MINIVRFCYSEIMARKLQLGICFLLSVLSSVTVSIMPYLNGYFIDTLITEKSLSSIWTLAIFSLVIISVGFIIGYIKSILIIRIQMSIEFEVFKRILKDVNDISISILRKLDKAALNQKVIKDTSIVVSFCTLSVPNMIVNAILLILYVTLISKLSIRFLFMIVVFSIMYYTLSKYFSKKLYDADKRAKKEQDQYYGRTFEQYNNIEFVKAHGLNDSLHHRLDGSFGGLLEATIARQKTSYVFSGIESYLALLSQLVIIFLGGKAVIENSMTLGDFVVLNSYVAMTLGMVKFFYNFEQTVQSTLASLHRLEEILILNQEIMEKGELLKSVVLAFQTVI